MHRIYYMRLCAMHHNYFRWEGSYHDLVNWLKGINMSDWGVSTLLLITLLLQLSS